MKHFMHLNEKPFRAIMEGRKTIELRLYDEKRKSIKPGDTIEFESTAEPGQRIIAGVKALHIFESFEKLYAVLPLEKCGYANDEISMASASDMNEYYSVDEQNKYGVVGIEFELLNN